MAVLPTNREFPMKYSPFVLTVAVALSSLAVAQASNPTSTTEPSAASQTTPATNQQPAPANQPAATPNATTTPAQTPTANAPDATASKPADTKDADSKDASSKDADTKDATAKDATTKDPLAKEATENLPKATDVKHDGSRDDVSAIGNRHIGTGKSPGDWYSIESEIRLGKSYSQQIEQGMKLVHDPVVTEYVNRIGQNLVRNSDARVPFTIKVVDSDEEAELAGVMAHEIAHVAARHATRQMTRAQIANIASIPLIFMGGGLGYALQGAASLALPMTFLKFSRGFEAE